MEQRWLFQPNIATQLKTLVRHLKQATLERQDLLAHGPRTLEIMRNVINDVVLVTINDADLWTCGMEAGRVAIQEVSSGRQPSKLGCMYTMPHLLTVAGDATAKSATSKIMFIKPDMAMISPLFRHNFLLSSSTCHPTPGPCGTPRWQGLHKCKLSWMVHMALLGSSQCRYIYSDNWTTTSRQTSISGAVSKVGRGTSESGLISKPSTMHEMRASDMSLNQQV